MAAIEDVTKRDAKEKEKEKKKAFQPVERADDDTYLTSDPMLSHLSMVPYDYLKFDIQYWLFRIGTYGFRASIRAQKKQKNKKTGYNQPLCVCVCTGVLGLHVIVLHTKCHRNVCTKYW